MTNTADIGSEIQNRINDIPSPYNNVGSLQTSINYVINDINNYAGVSIDSANIPSTYQNVIINLGCTIVMAAKMGVATNFNFRLGELEVDKRFSTFSPDGNALKFYQEQANEGLKWIGRKTQQTKVYGV